MKQNFSRKLNLGKKTITKLAAADANALNGGSVSVYTGTIVAYTNGCGSDFTRPRTTYQPGH